MVGNFNDIVLEEKYDYITLIGVLEYAAYYTDAKQPFESFLKRISSYLKEDGKLLIAIENKFGLKYWAGTREDHTGKFFDGLEGYIDTESSVRTFSKEGLKTIIANAGYMLICHANCPESVEYVKGLLKERFGVTDVRDEFIGPVIGAHTGCGTLGLFFVGTER